MTHHLTPPPRASPHQPHAKPPQDSRRKDLTELIAAGNPHGSGQATDRLRARKVKSDWMVKLKWIRAAEWAEVEYGTSRAGAVQVRLYRTANFDALHGAHPEID
ncbi:hypothetical protein ACFY5H_32885 [Streptomyces sp. NPDC013012]|uniref:hypothetical protein n=1 Tax=unclassified Streptomyces TaxID=2593676 RepID=UPI0036337089